MQTYPPDHPYLDLIDPAPNKADCGKFPARGFARLICSGKPGVPLAYIVLSGRERGWGSASSAPHRNGRYAAERTTRRMSPRRIDDDRRYDHGNHAADRWHRASGPRTPRTLRPLGRQSRPLGLGRGDTRLGRQQVHCGARHPDPVRDEPGRRERPPRRRMVPQSTRWSRAPRRWS